MPHILIVEDEDRIAKFIEKGLRQSGFRSSRVHDGNAALAFTKTESCDLVLLDLGLPGLSGWDVLEHLQKQGQKTPVIIVSAMTDESDRALKTGAVDFVGKPFSWSLLLKTIQTHLQKS